MNPQVTPLKQAHADKRLGIRDLSFHGARRAVPDYRRGMNVEDVNSAIGKHSVLSAQPGQFEGGHKRSGQRQKTVEAGVNDYLDLPGMSMSILDRERDRGL